MNDNRLARSRPPSVLVTERLILRTPCIEDALALFELARVDESFTRATFGTEPKSLEGTCTAIARMLADRKTGSGAWWIVTEKDSPRIVGLSGFSEREPESGLVNALARDALGNGYVRETVDALANVVAYQPYLHCAEPYRASAPPEEPTSARASRWYWQCKATRANRLVSRRCA